MAPASDWLIFRLLPIVLLGCFLCAFECPVNIAAYDRAIVFKEPLQNKVLEHHVIRTEKVPNEGSCRVKCFMEPDCVSINMGPLQNSGEISCELNNATGENEHKADLIERANYTHLAIKNPCTNNPCGNDCKCQAGFTLRGFRCKCISGNQCKEKSCSTIQAAMNFTAASGDYFIDPDGPLESSLPSFKVFCDMTDKNGIGVTVISHDSENRTQVDGYENSGSYTRAIHYTGANLSQLESLIRVSKHCEQSIKYECFHSRLHKSNNSDPIGWWVSRNGTKMTYWDGASGSNQCACAKNNSCANPDRNCNCDKDDSQLREDSGVLTNKSHLPVKEVRFGDTSNVTNANNEFVDEKGYHTLGKLKCYGIA
ncbi:contactin-associated protein 1-like [Montipora capricornis]|uniref:contactin-associated protein 1-like n=1 Tax=Montipora capricornis TaxID=246305 RepID=UPI0035F0FB25